MAWDHSLRTVGQQSADATLTTQRLQVLEIPLCRTLDSDPSAELIGNEKRLGPSLGACASSAKKKSHTAKRVDSQAV